MRRVPPLLISSLLLGASISLAQPAPASSASTPAVSAPAPAPTPAASAPSSAPSPAAGSLPLASSLDEDRTAELLWTRSPEFAATRARVASARADLLRAGLLPNPELDIGVGTLPLGPTNPPGLNRLTEVPNATVGLSQLLELGKRGPRQAAARSALASAALDVLATLRARTYDVQERAAEVATSEVRLSELERLTTDAARLTELQRARAQHGDAAGLDVDRAGLEEASLLAQLAEEHSRLAEALLTCSQTVGMTCAPFGSGAAAAEFLATGLSNTPPIAGLEDRPDLRSLAAQRQSAESALLLAQRRVIPDPTVRLGYMRDQFLTAGNQRDSLGVTLTFPLPVFDRGQADAQTASSAAEASAVARSQLLAQAQRDVASLAAQRKVVAARRESMRNKTLPMASSLVQRLEAAMKAGGASLQDLIFARRTYGQLLLDAADLDLAAFRLSVKLDRVQAAGPKAPAGLTEHF